MSIYDISGNEIGSSIEPVNATMSMFHRFGVCGASWDSGYYYDTPTHHLQRADVSWGANVARRNGNVFCNYSQSGMTTRTYLTNINCLPKLLSDTACDLYITTLGGNDSSNLGMNYLGTIEDITGHESYSEYPDTYYGNYGKIIEQIQGHAPNAKIIMIMSCGANATATRKAFSNAKDEIANHYGLPHLNWSIDPWYSSEFFQTTLVQAHPTPASLSGVGLVWERLFSQCVGENYDYFKFYNGSSF